MANEPIRGGTEAANFINADYVALTALEVLRQNMVISKRVLTMSDVGATYTKGAKFSIPYSGTFTRGTKGTGNAAEHMRPSGYGESEISLNKHHYVKFVVEDAAQAVTPHNLRNTYIAPAMISLVEGIENDIIALYSSVTDNVGTLTVDVTWATILELRKKLTDNKAPQNERYLMISTKDMNAMMQDTKLASYFANADPETIKRGAVAHIAGFDVFESQGAPTSGSNTYGIGWQKGAFCLATAIPPTPAEIGNTPNVDTSVMTDPESGLSLRVFTWYDTDYIGPAVYMDVLYGVGIARQQKACVVYA